MKMQLKLKFILKIITVFLIILNIGLLIYWYSYLYEECSSLSMVPASLKVEEGSRKVVGFNTETDSLKFGTVSAGSSVQRSVKVQYSKEAKVKIFSRGNLSSWLAASPSGFSLSAGETEEVFFKVDVPADAAPGDYSAEVKVCFQE
jgi:hypothetical protein